MSSRNQQHRCFVLGRRSYRDTDVIVELLSEEQGRITGLARAAKRSRRRFSGCLDLFAMSTILLAPGRGELWTLQSGTLERVFPEIAADLARYTYASYIAELVTLLAPLEQPEPGIFALFADFMALLVAGEPNPALLRATELRLLDELGVGPRLEACVRCDGELRTDTLSLDPSYGGVVCGDCAAGRSVPTSRLGAPVGRDCVERLMMARCHGQLEGAMSSLAGTRADDLRRVLVGWVQYNVTKPIKSLEFLRKMASSQVPPTQTDRSTAF